MKYANLQAFEKHLASSAPNHFADVYLVISKESFDREKGIESALAHLLKESKRPELDTNAFDGEVSAVAAILGELNTMPFLAKQKVVVVRRVDKLSKSELKALEAYVEQPNRAVKLVMSASEFTSNMTFYKKSEKSGVVLDVATKKAWAKESELVEWIEQQVVREGKRIDRRASQALARQSGTDQAVLEREVEKLICYVGDRSQVMEADVTAICTRINSDTVWQFGEAIFRFDAASALRIGRGMLDDGVALLALVSQLRHQFQTEIQVCAILAHGGTSQDVNRDFPFMSGNILERHCQMASGYGLDRFKRGLTALAETEVTAKNSGQDADLLLDRLLFKLTSKETR